MMAIAMPHYVEDLRFQDSLKRCLKYHGKLLRKEQGAKEQGAKEQKEADK